MLVDSHCHLDFPDLAGRLPTSDELAAVEKGEAFPAGALNAEIAGKAKVAVFACLDADYAAIWVQSARSFGVAAIEHGQDFVV